MTSLLQSQQRDNISVEKFKEKFWVTNAFFKKVDFIKIAERGNDLLALVEIITTDNKVVRNVDVYGFNNTGKIRSIEVFLELVQNIRATKNNNVKPGKVLLLAS